VADDCRAEAARVTGGDSICEEDPGMCAVARARDLQRDRRAELTTGKHKRLRIIPPVSFIEVHGKEVAGVVGQQRIGADRVITGQMLEQDGVGHRDQFAVSAFRTLDARLLAHSLAPFVSACGGVARLVRGLAFPANGVDVGPAAEQASEQGEFFRRRKPRRFRRCRRVRIAPRNTVRFEERDQAGVLGSKRRQ